jgi:hypothetical protein
MHRKHSSSGRRSRIYGRNPGGVHRQVQKTDHAEEDDHHSTQRHAPLGQAIWPERNCWRESSRCSIGGFNLKETKMQKLQIIAVIAGLLLSLTAGAQSKQGASTNKPDPLPRDLEIQLALSALPPHLRDNATVYVLNPDKGFEVARQGTNGFHAFVARTGDDTFRGAWPLKAYRDDILYPISFDEAGAKAQMRVFFDAAEMQAKGTPPEELKKTIQQRYKMHHYKPPERAGVSYMLSPILRTYVNPDQSEDVATANIPHVMYYAPNVTNQEVGAATPTPEQFAYFSQHGKWPETPYPILILHGPHGYMVQFRGVAERDEITKEDKGMLQQLCKIKEAWCLPH